MVRKQRRFKTPSPKKLVGAFLLVICLLFVLFPLLLMAAASFMPEDELARRYLAVLEWEESRCFRLWFLIFRL